MESFNMRHIQKMGLTSKDVIGPTALTFERDHMIVGNTYARALMIVDLPTFLRGRYLDRIGKYAIQYVGKCSLPRVATE